MTVKLQKTLLLLVLFCLIVPAKFARAGDAWLAYLQRQSSNTIQPLHEGWQILLEGESNPRTVSVPVLLPDGAGRAVLKYNFTIPKEMAGRTPRFHLSGLHSFATIKFNGTLLREHPAFPAPFFVDIPAKLLNESGNNELEIILRQPARLSEGFPEYVHLFREQIQPGIHHLPYIEWLTGIRFEKAGYNFDGTRLSFNYNLSINAAALEKTVGKKLRVEEELSDPSGKVVFTRFEYIDLVPGNKAFSRDVTINSPQMWSPETPQNYHLTLRARISEQILATADRDLGLRYFAVTGNRITLNGAELDIRGITHREFVGWPEPDKITLISPEEFIQQLRTDLKMIHEMGFNAVRFPHHYPHPYAFVIADSLGLVLLPETGLWRLPETLFNQDIFLQTVKALTDEILSASVNHASFMALGLGEEIPVNDSGVHKFLLILKEQVRQKYNSLSYVTPINDQSLPTDNSADFYLFNKYGKAVFDFLDTYHDYLPVLHRLPVLLGNVGFPAGRHTEDDSAHIQAANLEKAFTGLSGKKELGGYFLESLRDWAGRHSTYITQPVSANQVTYPFGLLDADNKTRYAARFITDQLEGKTTNNVHPETATSKTNFFTLNVFLSSILFFWFYRSNYRFRENVGRAIRHPYGFFVDLRERRIISILNSLTVGLFASLIFSNFVAAVIYIFHASYLFDEYIVSVLNIIGFRDYYLELVNHPIYLFLLIWLVSYLIQILAAFLLRLISVFTREKLRLRQAFAVSHWSGIIVLFFIPVSMFAWQLLTNATALPYVLALFGVFGIWINFRLARGVRVLFVMRPLRVFLLVVLIYSIVIISLIVLFESRFNMIDYFKLLSDARLLF
jgi:hypothetical protein